MDVICNIQLVGLLRVFNLIVKRYIAIQREKALEAIGKEVESESFVR
jgi:hypothetical protein